MEGIKNAANKYNIDFQVTYIGGMFGFFFTNKNTINNYKDVCSCNNEIFKVFFNLMLEKGIYFAPSSFEAGFISSEHSDKDINYTINASEEVFKEIRKKFKIK